MKKARCNKCILENNKGVCDQCNPSPQSNLQRELEEKLTQELDLLLGEYHNTGDDSRGVNILELFEQELQKAREERDEEIREIIEGDFSDYTYEEMFKSIKTSLRDLISDNGSLSNKEKQC